MRLREALHDEIDSIESVRNRVAEIVDEVVSKNITRALNETETAEEALEFLAALVEDEMTDITTAEFQAGVTRALRRYGDV